MGPEALGDQIEALSDAEPMCRYWGLIGLQTQKTVTPEMISVAEELLTDPAPYVRYEAAFFCLKHSQEGHPDAREVLVAGIHESHTILVNHAMRKIALLEKAAEVFIDDVNAIERTYRNLGDRKKTYEIQTSIKAINLRLSGQVPSPQDNY